MKNMWFKISDKIRFLLIGGFNTLISIIIFYILIKIFGGKHYQAILVFTWTITSFISYTTQHNLVFNSKGSRTLQYLKCCATWIIGYIINALLLEIFIKHANFPVLPAQIISVSIVAIINYILLKYFAFKKY